MKIKELRQKNNLSQTDLAKAVNTSQRSISNYEKGFTDPDIKTLKAMATYFHTTIDNIVGFEVPYLLDKSTLTEEQKEIIEIVPSLTYEECKLMMAYLAGIKKGIEERNKNFKLNKKEED